MRHLLVFLAVLASDCCAAQPHKTALRRIAVLPQTADIASMQFVSERVGFYVAKDFLWRTDDGGRTWTHLSDLSADLVSARFIKYAAVIGVRGAILSDNALYVTSDGGLHWAECGSIPMGDNGGELWGMQFSGLDGTGWIWGGLYEVASSSLEGPNDVFLGRPDGTRLVVRPAIFYTGDAGVHWERQSLPALVRGDVGRIVSASFTDDQHGAASDGSRAFYTTNGGRSWAIGRLYRSSAKAVADDEEMLARLVYCRSDLNCWVALDDGSLYRTSDGARWDQVLAAGALHSQFADATSRFVSLAFSSESIGWGIDLSGTLLQTRDGGVRWRRVDAEPGRFSEVVCAGHTRCLAVTSDSLYELPSPSGTPPP